MTCIAALVSHDKVWMGGDSAAVGGHYSLTIRKDQKVFRKGDFLLGFTSSFRMGQLLAHQFQPPARPEGMELHEYMVVKFVEGLRETFKLGGYAQKEKEAENGGTFLVGYCGRIFKICDDYQVAESVYPFDACGCGEDVALGALYAQWNGVTGKVEFDEPNRALRTALVAAERFSAGVRGPFNVYVDDDLIGKDYDA